MKNLLKLNGAQPLSRDEQKLINGSGGGCTTGCDSGFLGHGSICNLTPDCQTQGICANAPWGGLQCIPK